MNTATKPLSATALTLGALLLSQPAQAQEDFTVPLSRPGEAMTLEIDLLSGSIEVIGEDRDDVQITVSASGSKRRIVTPSGAKPIPVSSYALEIEEKNNYVEVDSDYRAGPMQITARVPHSASLKLDTVHKGSIEVTDVTGTHELSNVHGPITALALRGTVVAETVHGTVRVELLDVESDKAMAFTTVHGDVDIAFPGDFSGDIAIESRNDEIYSDFEVEVMPAEPKVRRDSRGNGVSFKMEQELRVRIGSGTIPVRMETLHGKVFIRRSDS